MDMKDLEAQLNTESRLILEGEEVKIVLVDENGEQRVTWFSSEDMNEIVQLFETRVWKNE